MLANPERLKNKIPKVALVAAALISFSVKAEASPSSTESISHQTQVGSVAVSGSILNSPNLNNQNTPLQYYIGPLSKLKETPTTSTTTTTTIPLTPQQVAEEAITPNIYAMWYKVHECEEPEVYNKEGQLISGGWQVHGANSSGGLGILDINWIKFDGNFFAPTGDLSDPKAQMVVAENISHGFVPDQEVCSRTGW